MGGTNDQLRRHGHEHNLLAVNERESNSAVNGIESINDPHWTKSTRESKPRGGADDCLTAAPSWREPEKRAARRAWCIAWRSRGISLHEASAHDAEALVITRTSRRDEQGRVLLPDPGFPPNGRASPAKPRAEAVRPTITVVAALSGACAC